jgi:hypothetical protein
MDNIQINNLDKRFRNVMTVSNQIFGKNAFRKRGKGLQPINKTLFEVISVNIDSLNAAKIELLIKNKESFDAKFVGLLEDVEFNSAISLATGDPRKIKYRFSAIQHIIDEVLS